GVGGDLREPEIEELHDAVGSNLDVGRLEIAVNDPLFMRDVECVRNLLRDHEGLADRKRVAAHSLAQRLAFDQLEDDPADGLTALGDILFEAVDGADVGMIQRRKYTRFALEARQAV